MLDNYLINYFKSKRGLFIFSDPGGAKPLLSLINLYGLTDYMVISDRRYDFFIDFEVKVDLFVPGNEKKTILDFNPDYLLTGTSYTSNVELNFIQVANKLNINTFSYIVHYIDYKQRFKFINSYIFPKNIILIDEKSEKIAIENNLALFSKLHILYNFYHEFLKRWKAKSVRRSFLKNIEIKPYLKIIVFAPDPISNINYKQQYLFNEIDVWKDFSYVINRINVKNFIIIVKLHPNQNKNFLIKAINMDPIDNVFYFNQNNSIDLLYHSDLIVGMFSSILREAAIFETKILRHLPSVNFEDPLKDLGIGIKSTNRKELFKNLTQYL